MNKAKEVRVKKLESLKIRQDATVFESSEYKRIQRMVNTLILEIKSIDNQLNN